MASLWPRTVVWSLYHANFALVVRLTGVKVRHVILGLRVGYLTEVIVMLLYWLLCVWCVLLLGTLRLWVSVDDARISNLVTVVLRGLDLLAVMRVRVPVDVRAVWTVVVAVWWVLELRDHILLVRCSSSWSHIWLVKSMVGVCWEGVLVLLRSLLLHYVVLTHVHGGHSVFTLVKDLVRLVEHLSHAVTFTLALPLHVWIRNRVRNIAHHLVILHTPRFLLLILTHFPDLSLFSRRWSLLDRRRGGRYHSSGSACRCSEAWLSRGSGVHFLKWAVEVSTALQISLGKYHIVVASWFNAALMLLLLRSCGTLLGRHQLVLILDYCTLTLLGKPIICFLFGSANWIVVGNLICPLLAIAL